MAVALPELMDFLTVHNRITIACKASQGHICSLCARALLSMTCKNYLLINNLNSSLFSAVAYCFLCPAVPANRPVDVMFGES